MAIIESIKQYLGIVCGFCGAKELSFRCNLCRRKYCESCVEAATAKTRAGMEHAKREALLELGTLAGDRFTLPASVIDQIDRSPDRGCCPGCWWEIEKMPSCEPLGP
jgi:hypothetical protein